MLGVTRHDDVVILELQRPEQRNALDLDQCRRLHKTLDEAVDARARAIVITGSGSVFCSGADLAGVYGEEFLTAM
jgi:enoyl-CoA hydratase